MNRPTLYFGWHLSPAQVRQLDQACDQLESAWKAGLPPRLEDHLGAFPQELRAPLLTELLRIELAYRHRDNQRPTPAEYAQRFPDQASAVEAAFRVESTGLFRPDPPSSGELSSHAEPTPERLGRYRVLGLLGRGSFGTVYRAADDELEREVAIKVPHSWRMAAPADREVFLAEARILAGLDHPHIVPVYDVGTTLDGWSFVVSKLIRGTDLRGQLQQGRPCASESARLVSLVAEALHHAHTRGLVHRDVKPANILLDAGSRPYVADFGLALRQEDFGRGEGFAGTPAYMSPEQARGEGRRVDGRSDVFSLGVVLYELLTGQRPFRADTRAELLAQVLASDPRPPRQIDDTLPSELERICLKALTRRVTDRYTTARDFADDLGQFLAGVATDGSSRPDRPEGPRAEEANLLHLVWDQLDPSLQDAFLLAYNKKRREGSGRISTRDLFQALLRINDDSLRGLLDALPSGALPEAAAANVPIERHIMEDSPQLSDCVADSLRHFLRAQPLPRKLTSADVFVDLGKHGYGPSVAMLREHGVTAEELERQVRRIGLSVLRRQAEQ
jgi:serine/threonine protein kinase